MKNNMITILKKNKYWIFCFCLIIINFLIIKIKIKGMSNVRFICTISILVVLEIFFSVILKKIIDRKIKLENIFLILILPIGLMFLILIPIGQTPDEHTHFLRINEILEGKIISDKEGTNLPIEIYDSLISQTSNDNYRIIFTKLKSKDSGNERNYPLSNAAVYSFVSYIPQLMGVLFGKLLKLPIIYQAYLGRLFNFIAWIILIYLSVKYVPIGKEIIVFVSMLPITIQEAISLSPDALTYSSIVFLVCYTFYLKYTKDKVIRIDFLILTIMCIVVSLCKIVYLPICLLLFIIPKEKFKSVKLKYIQIIILAIVVLIINMVWLKIASGLILESQDGVDSKNQELFILFNPLSYLLIIIRTIVTKLSFYVYSMFGEYLQTLNINVTKFYPSLSILCVVFFVLNYIDKKKFKDKLNDGFIVFIIISVALLIFTSLYIQWTPLKNNVIEGVQGRYFLPILPLFLLLLIKDKNEKIKYDLGKVLHYTLLICIYSNLFALAFIFSYNG